MKPQFSEDWISRNPNLRKHVEYNSALWKCGFHEMWYSNDVVKSRHPNFGHREKQSCAKQTSLESNITGPCVYIEGGHTYIGDWERLKEQNCCNSCSTHCRNHHLCSEQNVGYTIYIYGRDRFDCVDFEIYPEGFGVWEGLQSIGNGCGLQMDGFSAYFEPYGSIFDNLWFWLFSDRFRRSDAVSGRSQDPPRLPWRSRDLMLCHRGGRNLSGVGPGWVATSPNLSWPYGRSRDPIENRTQGLLDCWTESPGTGRSSTLDRWRGRRISEVSLVRSCFLSVRRLSLLSTCSLERCFVPKCCFSLSMILDNIECNLGLFGDF